MSDPTGPLVFETIDTIDDEGDVDRAYIIFADENVQDVVLLPEVRSDQDFLEKSPVVGQIDLEKVLGESSITETLTELPEGGADIHVSPDGKDIRPLTESGFDTFAVSSTEWLDDPQELAWSSMLLSKLQARIHALTDRIQNPVNLAKVGEKETREQTALAALQWAQELEDDALAELQKKIGKNSKTRSELISSSLERTKSYSGSNPDSVSQQDVEELYQGGN